MMYYLVNNSLSKFVKNGSKVKATSEMIQKSYLNHAATNQQIYHFFLSLFLE